MDSVGNSHSNEFNPLHYRIIAIVAIMYAQCAIESAIIPIVLPAVTCDYSLDSVSAGYLTSIPLIGTGLGCLCWGICGDVLGRKRALFISMAVTAASAIASSISQNFLIFIFFRTIDSFGLAGILTLIFSYLSENMPENKKDVVLSCTELWYTVGMIILPLIAWLIIPLDVNYETDYFQFHSWNLLVLVSGILELACCVFFFTLPETTEFLKQRKEDVSAQQLSGITRESRSIMSASRDLIHQFKLLFARDQRKSTIVCGIFSFCVELTYITISTWLPEIVSRMSYYEQIHSNEGATLCEMTSVYVINANATEKSCAEGYSSEVYISTLAMGIICLPTSIILALLGNKFGFKFFVVFPQIICCIGIACLIFVKSSLIIMIISWSFVSFISITIEATWISLVDIFPVRIRAAGGGFTAAIGKFGGLVGNLAIGYLIDLYCIIPVVTFTIFLAGTTVMSCFIPFKKNRKI